MSVDYLENVDKSNLDQVKSACAEVCREYLSGVWKEVKVDDVKVQRLTGGCTNYLYSCSLTNDKLKAKRKNEPKDILVRFYGEYTMKSNLSAVPSKDVVVAIIMSELKLGPKIYGLFPFGRLEELLPIKTLEVEDMLSPEISALIARAVARYNTLEMPFNKKPEFFDSVDKNAKLILDVKLTKPDDVELYNKLMSLDLVNEWNQLKKYLESLGSPIVFCHNDINVGNVLRLQNQLMLIDYEYSAYNYRGFDIGNFFCEMMMNNNTSESPYFSYNFELYPDEKQQRNFARAYLEEWDKSWEKVQQHDENSHAGEVTSEKQEMSEEQRVEKLLHEANCFAMASDLHWAFWGFVQAAGATHHLFRYLDYANARVDAYFRHKQRLFPNGFKNN